MPVEPMPVEPMPVEPVPVEPMALTRQHRVVILGGGIAGLCCSLRLSALGVQHFIIEQDMHRDRHGHGFILLQEGVSALGALGVRDQVVAKGHPISQFQLYDPQGTLTMATAISGALGMRRGAFIDALEAGLQPGILRQGAVFSHFARDTDGRATHACLDDGSRLQADLFIASDGSRSRVRAQLFADHRLSPVRVRELVCHVHDPALARWLGERFLKYQRREGKLAVGMVPCGRDEVIWYLQFDAEAYQLQGNSSDEKRAFALQVAGDWCDPVATLLHNSNYDLSYVWNTTDLDPLPALGHGSVVLIGDAAHAFLPFTSQGVNAALQDVAVLTAQLEEHWFAAPLSTGLAAALQGYASQRLPDIARIVLSGRELRQRFLHPELFAGQAVVPISK